MCGIAGFTFPAPLGAARVGPRLRRMIAALHHRGPDADGVHLRDGVALGHARLAILDLTGGAQPMVDPETGVALVYNGEVFNHPELRAELAGYPFRTRSDTEVLLAAYLRWGRGCLDRLNGQFAFAVSDPRDRSLWLVRDRFGILPLFYALHRDGLAFASEARALVAGGYVDPVLDPRGVKQTLQLWSSVPPRTSIAGVSMLPPGAEARWADGRLDVRRWWRLDLGHPDREASGSAAEEELGALLDDAVRLRLRADVPVAAYLSGGLDSSVVCESAQRQLGGGLHTFSVAFSDRGYDESEQQREVAGELGTRHHTTLSNDELVATLLPEAVAHAETVLVRAAPVPLLSLSRSVRDAGVKVVLTGEGSDEILLGYDLYAEARARAFWARQPSSRIRPALLRQIHPYLGLGAQGDAVLRATFGVGLEDPGAPAFSHLVRWGVTSRLWRLFSPDFTARVADELPVATLTAALPPEVRGWPLLARAQHLEMETLLAGNLLAAQGDRMLMGGSVEGRFPFLDHRVVELAARLPVSLKLRGLTGKWLLRKWASRRLPAAVADRPKYPYRAPPLRRLAGPGAPEWAREVLAPEALRAVGVFDPIQVGRLVAKLSRNDLPVSEVDAMGVTAVLSAQLLARHLGSLAAETRRELAEVA